MIKKSIRTLEIGNFKSIDSLRLRDLAPFSVFAGANGSGKSNFVDALDFVSIFVRHGIEAALQNNRIRRHRPRRDCATGIESWFLADTDAMQRWLGDPTFYEANPEMPSNTSWDRLKEISRERSRRGPGRNRRIFARKIIRSYQFDVTRAAQHPHCPSARYFVDRLRRLAT